MKALNNVLPFDHKGQSIEWSNYEEVHRTKAMAIVSLFAHLGINEFRELNISNGFDIHQSKSFSSQDQRYQLYFYIFTVKHINIKDTMEIAIIVGIDVKLNGAKPKVFGISKPKSFANETTNWIRTPNNWYHLDL